MTYPKRTLEIVTECNDENDNPTTWAMLAGKSYRDSDEFGSPSKSHFIWIEMQKESQFAVVDSHGYNLADGKVYKTLNGAKRKAEEIAFRQDDTGCYTN